MSVDLCDDCEYSILVADLIKTLANWEHPSFTLNVWTHNRDLPFQFENDCDFLFLQEGLKITDDNGVRYIFYDEIEYILVVNE